MQTLDAEKKEGSGAALAEKKDALAVIDRRTGKSYEIPIADGTIRAIDLRQIKIDPQDFGLMSYDPAFMNTAACKSRITFIDGEKGILRYRGYPIEQLAEKSSYLEVAYLLLNGELPTQVQHDEWVHHITFHTMLQESLKKFMDGFNYDAHPMGMLIGTVAAMSTFYPDAHDIHDPVSRQTQAWRLIAKMPTLAALAYRHSMGMPYIYPDNDLSYTENFLNMLFKIPSASWRPDPVLVRALDVLFILHADHEQNCGTHAMRGIGSSHPDPYSAVAGAAAALYGPLHGGANEEVLKMLQEISSVSRVPAFIKEVKEGKGEKRLMGFGHRVYKNYDPRAKIIDYFVKRKLYPNVDFYSGLIYQAMGFPTTVFTVLFAIPRTAGWIAQWEEMLADPEQKIARPRQVYLGPAERNFVPIDRR